MASKRGARDKGAAGRAPSKPPFAFGSDEEIAARGDDRRMASEDVKPTNFKQIAPSTGGGGILRAPLQIRKTGRNNMGAGPGQT